jgi:L-ectoine synthase
MHYQQHLESVYCMSGTGRLKNLADNSVHQISPGTLYILDQHDKHILYADEELSLACVFNPPITGNETHNEEGSYPLVTE